MQTNCCQQYLELHLVSGYHKEKIHGTNFISILTQWVKVKVVHSCLTLQPCNFIVHGILQARMGSLSLLQGIFPTQGWNPGLQTLQAGSLSAETQGKPKNTQFDSIETTVVSVTRDLYLEVFNGRFSLSYLSLFYLIWRSKSAEAYNQSLFKHLFTQLLRLTFVCMFLYLTSHCYQLFLLDYSFPSSKNLRPLQLSDEESFLLSICNHNYITWF